MVEGSRRSPRAPRSSSGGQTLPSSSPVFVGRADAPLELPGRRREEGGRSPRAPPTVVEGRADAPLELPGTPRWLLFPRLPPAFPGPRAAPCCQAASPPGRARARSHMLHTRPTCAQCARTRALLLGNQACRPPAARATGPAGSAIASLTREPALDACGGAGACCAPWESTTAATR